MFIRAYLQSLSYYFVHETLACASFLCPHPALPRGTKKSEKDKPELGKCYGNCSTSFRMHSQINSILPASIILMTSSLFNHVYPERCFFCACCCSCNQKSRTKLLDELLTLNDNTFATTASSLVAVDATKRSRFKVLLARITDEAARICAWPEKSVTEWAVEARKRYADASVAELDDEKAMPVELIAVACRAIELAKGHFPRDAQLLALLLMLSSDFRASRGRFLQVATGEGKTIIVALMAAVMAIRGTKVDIVTSSPELAKDGAESLKQFYNMLNLTVDHIGRHETNSNETKKACYANDVLYGTMCKFQGDVLEHEFHETKVRGEKEPRPFACCIFDEVDSMLMDDVLIDQRLMLDNTVPGAECFGPLFVWLWADLQQNVFNNELIKQHPSRLHHYSVDKAYFENQCVHQHDSPRNNERRICVHRNEVKKHLQSRFEQKLRRMLDGSYNRWDASAPVPVIPAHLLSFAQRRVPAWVDAMLRVALCFVEVDLDYVVGVTDRDEFARILPVDYENTGWIQTNMHFSVGMHQFLQIKHGLKLTPEGIMTTFISNLAYAKRYDRIFGLTGTLGTSKSGNFQFLKRLYNVELALIPTFRKSRLKKMDNLWADNEQDWHEKIVGVVREIVENRAVLIISNTIKDTMKIKAMLQDSFPLIKLREYYDNTAKTGLHGVVETLLQPGDIVLATNLAGRGTNFLTSNELETNGGLHVLITFLPRNGRVGGQAKGRTARQGNEGSSQLVINKQTLGDDFAQSRLTGQDLFDARDEREKKTLIDFDDRLRQTTEFKDKLFCTFSKSVRALRAWRGGGEDFVLKQLDEWWGFFLDEHVREHHPLDFADVEARYKKFIGNFINLLNQSIMQGKTAESIIENPAYLLRFLFHNGRFDNHPEQAIFLLTNHRDNGAFTRYYRALAHLTLYEELHPTLMQQADDELKHAVEAALKSAAWLQWGALKAGETKHKSDFSRQIEFKLRVLAEFRKRCECARASLSACDGDANNLSAPFSTKIVPLEECFGADVIKYKEEIDEFKCAGLLGFYDVPNANKKKTNRNVEKCRTSEINDSTNFSFMLMALVAIAQIFFGCYAMLYTHVELGAMLVLSGLADTHRPNIDADGVIRVDVDVSWTCEKTVVLTSALLCWLFSASVPHGACLLTAAFAALLLRMLAGTMQQSRYIIPTIIKIGDSKLFNFFFVFASLRLLLSYFL